MLQLRLVRGRVGRRRGTPTHHHWWSEVGNPKRAVCTHVWWWKRGVGGCWPSRVRSMGMGRWVEVGMGGRKGGMRL